MGSNRNAFLYQEGWKVGLNLCPPKIIYSELHTFIHSLLVKKERLTFIQSHLEVCEVKPQDRFTCCELSSFGFQPLPLILHCSVASRLRHSPCLSTLPSFTPLTLSYCHEIIWCDFSLGNERVQYSKPVDFFILRLKGGP